MVIIKHFAESKYKLGAEVYCGITFERDFSGLRIKTASAEGHDRGYVCQPGVHQDIRRDGVRPDGGVVVLRNSRMNLSAFTSAGLGACHIILSAGTRTVAGMVWGMVRRRIHPLLDED